MKVIFLQTKHEARYFVIGKWHIGKVGNQDWAIAKKILCPDCQEAARRSHTGGELVRDVWNRVFALAHTHCSNCAHTVCRVPTSPILGPASRCRHFVSRCPTALLLRYRVWHIVFHHMVISLHIVSTLMTHSTPSQIAKWLRITHADLTLYWANFWHMKKKNKNWATELSCQQGSPWMGSRPMKNYKFCPGLAHKIIQWRW